jgi:heme/copper-type cytochrome/quinol oxidase subunit 2
MTQKPALDGPKKHKPRHTPHSRQYKRNDADDIVNNNNNNNNNNNEIVIVVVVIIIIIIIGIIPLSSIRQASCASAMLRPHSAKAGTTTPTANKKQIGIPTQAKQVKWSGPHQALPTSGATTTSQQHNARSS